MTTPTGVEEYIAALPSERRAAIEELRRIVKAAAPEATEAIAYQIPALRMRGKILVSYAAFKAHYSLFPASEAVRAILGDELAPYLAGKGTISFPADRPLPLSLVTRVVEVRLEETATRRR